MSTTGSSRPLTIVSWVFQIIVAAIFVMAALPKLTGDDASEIMFEYLGAPWGRYVVGVAELAAAALLVIPRTIAFGGLLAAVLMIGAAGSHLTKLGIKIDPMTIAEGDPAKAATLADAGLEGPGMFIMAVGALALSVGVAALRFGPLKSAGAPANA